MGSVIDYEACPKCAGVMMVDHYYRSGEEYSMCQRCGYYRAVTMKRDEEKNIIFVEYDGNEVPDLEEEVHEGFGSYRIMSKEGGGQGGGFSEPISEETIKEFMSIFAQDDVDESTSYLMRFENGETEVIMGTPEDMSLLSFEEFDKKMGEEAERELESVRGTGVSDEQQSNKQYDEIYKGLDSDDLPL